MLVRKLPPPIPGGIMCTWSPKAQPMPPNFHSTPLVKLSASKRAGKMNHQGGECDAVPEHMLGRASHAHCPRADPFEKGQADPDQDEQQQGVFNQ